MCSTNVGTSIGFALISINFSLDALGRAIAMILRDFESLASYHGVHTYSTIKHAFFD